MKKQQNEELQSRREFFKKAAKSALPILGAIVLTNAPVIANTAEETPMSCNYYCSGGCQGGCGRSCSYDCTGGCKGGCGGGCSYSCQNTCKGSCQGTCSGYCSSMNSF